MPSRPVVVIGAALVAAAVVVAWRAVPSPSGAGASGSGDVAAVVALRHHDQQGIVLAHQAAAQSPSPATRARATALATAFTDQAGALSVALDARGVPASRRTVDTTRLDIDDAGAVGCDLMPKDAVSDLAAAAPDRFDATFDRLMGRHLVGGLRMSATVLGDGALGAAERSAVRAAQRGLA